jgi:hypothetical protein
MTVTAFTSGDQPTLPEDQPEYVFNGFTVDTSQKIALTPLGRNRSPSPEPPQP